MFSKPTKVDWKTIKGLKVARIPGKRGRQTVRHLSIIDGISPGVHYNAFQNNIDAVLRAVCERLYCVKDSQGNYYQPEVPDHRLVKESLSPLAVELANLTKVRRPLTRRQFVDCYKGARKERMAKAAESLESKPIQREDAYWKIFLKFETYNLEDKPDPSPRGINPPDDRYLVEFGRYIHSIEKDIFRNIATVFGYTVIMKGMNQQQRGELIERYWNEIDDPVCKEADASRFEQSVDEPHLECEFDVYRAYYRGKDLSDLNKLLSWQINNVGKGRTQDGIIKFSIKGKRGSGQKNTSVGNCIISCELIYGFLKKYCISTREIRFFCDGDDCSIIIPRRLQKIFDDNYSEYCSERGFRMKLKNKYRLEHIDFCQSRPVWTPAGYLMVRNPIQAMSKDMHCRHDLTAEKLRMKWMKAVGECGIATCGGVPMMQEFYQALIRESGNVRALHKGHKMFEDYTRYKVMGMNRNYQHVSERTRASFHEAFGIHPSLQESYEQECRDFRMGSETVAIDRITRRWL